MGKRIIQRARGHGSLTYRVKKKAFSIKPRYNLDLEGEWEIVKLISSAGHTAPIAKLRNKQGKIFFNIAADKIFEGQKINIGGQENGDVCMIKDLKNGTSIFNIENRPKDGGQFVRTGGNSAKIVSRKGDRVIVLLPSKQEKEIDGNCRATIGEVAGQGRLDKPILKAGKKHHIKKAKSKLWHITSAVKMNAVDHPFGSGRGKRIKSKIAKRNAPAGRKVGLLRPRRTGRRKK